MDDFIRKGLNFIIRTIKWNPKDYFYHVLHNIIISVVIFYYWYTSPVPYTIKSYFFHMLSCPFIIAIISTFFVLCRACY